MRIKLAILEKDQSYLGRIVTAFNTKYSDKLEIYSFTTQDIAMSALETNRIDVFVASDAFEIDVAQIPKRCGFAYFVDSADVDAVNEQRAISKFQKADLIYKQIVSIYSEKAGSVSGLKFGDDNAKVILFASPCGGCGTSTMAAACAKYYAQKGKKTLYLNLENYGSADVYFKAEGQFDMSDVIFALKSKNTNLSLKLESSVKQDQCGVNFYSQSKLALDMLELSAEDINRLISEVKLMGSYDIIIVDMDFSMDKEILKIYRQAHSWVWVGDGSEVSNSKVFRAYNAINTLEANAEAPLTSRICLAYNKFSSKTSKALSEIELKNIGGAPRFEHASVDQVLDQLKAKDMFEKII